MPKYINTEKIELKYEFGIVSDEGIVCVPMRDVKKSIEDTPAADVVEVVRCKDCKYYKRNGTDYGECPFFDEVKDDEYCSSGEAKMDGKGESNEAD